MISNRYGPMILGPRVETRGPLIRRLFELEVCAMDRTVVQLHYQLSTRTSPGRIGLPHVDVSIRCGIVTKAAAARRYCLRQITCRIARVAGDWS